VTTIGRCGQYARQLCSQRSDAPAAPQCTAPAEWRGFEAHALRHADVEIVLIDRRNHHIFQPLLYQVATAVLSPAEIAAPIRQIEVKQRNVTVLLGEVTGIDVASRTIEASSPGAGGWGKTPR
jgi:NADPH-dependent 2,4-dienoyl-CoA reductase/sulfur reductase-like enzyme